MIGKIYLIFIDRNREPQGEVSVLFALPHLRVINVPLQESSDSKNNVNNILAYPVSRMNLMKVWVEDLQRAKRLHLWTSVNNDRKEITIQGDAVYGFIYRDLCASNPVPLTHTIRSSRQAGNIFPRDGITASLFKTHHLYVLPILYTHNNTFEAFTEKKRSGGPRPQVDCLIYYEYLFKSL